MQFHREVPSRPIDRFVGEIEHVPCALEFAGGEIRDRRVSQIVRGLNDFPIADHVVAGRRFGRRQEIADRQRAIKSGKPWDDVVLEGRRQVGDENEKILFADALWKKQRIQHPFLDQIVQSHSNLPRDHAPPFEADMVGKDFEIRTNADTAFDVKIRSIRRLIPRGTEYVHDMDDAGFEILAEVGALAIEVPRAQALCHALVDEALECLVHAFSSFGNWQFPLLAARRPNGVSDLFATDPCGRLGTGPTRLVDKSEG